MGEVDIAVIKKTQETLGKFVKKPPLSDKLLKKPPFRFLHDIVNVVIKDTGYLKGLYSTNDLNSENIKERDDKIKFLQSLIDVVKLSTEKKLTVKPTKIVAGQEPEKTNELLQAIAYAIENKIDSTKAIATVKNGENNIPKKTSQKPLKRETVNSIKDENEKSKINKIPKKTVQTGKEKPKVTNKKILTKKNETNNNNNNKLNPIKISNNEKENKEVIVEKKLETPETKIPAIKDELIETKTETLLPVKENLPAEDDKKEIKPITSPPAEIESDQNIQSTKNIIQPPSSIEDSNDSIKSNNIVNEKSNSILNNEEIKSNSIDTDENVQKNTLEQIKEIPAEIKPAPTSLVIEEKTIKTLPETIQPSYIRKKSGDDKNHQVRTTLRPPSVRPASARPGAPRRRDKNIEIILQPEEIVKLGEINVKVESPELEDDGENLVIIEDPEIQDKDELLKNKNTELNDDTIQQGHLVQQILETQNEFKNSKVEDNFSEKNWSKQRNTSAAQVDSLRESLQKLTRSINPLGKLLDFLQEDIDSMDRELDKWKETYKQTKIELIREKGLNDNAIEPMKHQLAQIEINIKEHKEMINTSRANILLNESKIYKLLTE